MSAEEPTELPQWLRPGANVWYQSSPHHRHAGVVIGEPRRHNNGWVVPIGELDPPIPGTDRRVSSAAWYECLTPRVTDAEWAQLARAILRETLFSLLERRPVVTDPPAIWHAAAAMSGEDDQPWYDASLARVVVRAVAEAEGIVLPPEEGE